MTKSEPNGATVLTTTDTVITSAPVLIGNRSSVICADEKPREHGMRLRMAIHSMDHNGSQPLDVSAQNIDDCDSCQKSVEGVIPGFEKEHRYRGIFNFTGSPTNDELPFKVDDVLEILMKDASGWWLARDQQNNEGFIPHNYVQPL